MLGNLAEQLENLNIRVDSAGMRKVTEHVMATKKGKKSIFDDASGHRF